MSILWLCKDFVCKLPAMLFLKPSDGTICFFHFDSNRTNKRINKHVVIIPNVARRGTVKLLLVSLLRKLKEYI